MGIKPPFTLLARIGECGKDLKSEAGIALTRLVGEFGKDTVVEGFTNSCNFLAAYLNGVFGADLVVKAGALTELTKFVGRRSEWKGLLGILAIGEKGLAIPPKRTGE